MCAIATEEAQRRFLVALIDADMNVSKAAQAVGVGRRTVYHWRRDETFAARMEAAGAVWRKRLSVRHQPRIAAQEARRAARLLELRPIYQKNAANARAARMRKLGY